MAAIEWLSAELPRKFNTCLGMLTCMLIERIRKEPTLAEAPLNIYIS